MLVLKRWVWPGLKFLVAFAIAVALVQLAFFASSDADARPASASAETPTGVLEDPVVGVTRGTIRNDVEIEAQIEPIAAATVRATAAGTMNAVHVPVGKTVEAGAPIVQIRTETPVDPPSNPDAPQPKPKIAYVDVPAPASGSVSSMQGMVGQEVAIGDPIAMVAPGSFRVSGKLNAEDLYRLLQRPTEASVTIPGGPAPFTCTNLTIALTGSSSEGAASDAEPTTGKDTTSLTCDVPSDVTVFAGLTATVIVPAGVAEDVLTVPLTAVAGTAGSGTVTMESDKETRAVTLGMNDGKSVEVTEGLAEGDRILEFVPGTDAPEDDDETFLE